MLLTRSERMEENERLKKLTGREVDFRTVECPCDYWKYCDKCSGGGAYHEPFYLFCNHPVVDGPDLECEEADCAERERRRTLMEAVENREAA